MLIREAFLCGISTRQVGRIVATVTGEPVSAQTVSKLTRELDDAVRQFHSAELSDEWVYLFLDGVSLRVRRPGGRKRVQMLVAYGVKHDGTRHLLAFQRSSGESQQAWEGLLQDLYRRGLIGKQLQLIITDGCPGLAAALQIVYPRVPHQRCWVHKMRNILEKARKRDYDELKAGAQAIYLAGSAGEARELFRRFRKRWKEDCPVMVKQLEKDLPELLSFFRFPRHLWRKLPAIACGAHRLSRLSSNLCQLAFSTMLYLDSWKAYLGLDFLSENCRRRFILCSTLIDIYSCPSVAIICSDRQSS